MKKLSEEKIDGESKYRIKMTDAVEKPTNTYRSLFGDEILYNKICKDYGKYRLYKLPIHLFVDSVFYPGVLLNKFLYNPQFISVSQTDLQLIRDIQNSVKEYCNDLKKQGFLNASVSNSCYRSEEISEAVRERIG